MISRTSIFSPLVRKHSLEICGQICFKKSDFSARSALAVSRLEGVDDIGRILVKFPTGNNWMGPTCRSGSSLLASRAVQAAGKASSAPRTVGELRTANFSRGVRNAAASSKVSASSILARAIAR